MRLYILRHGEAQRIAGTDAVRQLTERGRIDVTRVAKQHLSGAGINGIIASPYLRAQQTAETVKQAIGFAKPIETLEFITPDGEPALVTRWLSEQACDQLVLVSHQPLVGLLVSYLTEGHFQSPSPLGTSNLAVLDYEEIAPGTATRKAVYRPD